MKSSKYEENELKLRRLEERLIDMQQTDERKASAAREEVSKLKNIIETARLTRERIFESDFGEFTVLERRLKALLDQSARVS